MSLMRSKPIIRLPIIFLQADSKIRLTLCSEARGLAVTQIPKLAILMHTTSQAPIWAILVNMEISVILGHEKTKIQNIID